uniref:Uncharacterized protein n=1 Tax=Amphimedon queenslandica TaxID=400682 RepID=A0A1X7VSK0_AMPQE
MMSSQIGTGSSLGSGKRFLHFLNKLFTGPGLLKLSNEA